jgi:hypothetical protein
MKHSTIFVRNANSESVLSYWLKSVTAFGVAGY